MYKNIFFILLIVLAGAGAVFAFSQTGTPTEQSTSAVQETSTSTYKETNLSQDQNGISITIEKIEQRENSTVLTLGLSNHQYNLGEDSIFDGATLNGTPSLSHTLLSNAVGGHHVQAEVAFEKTTSGSFEITPVEGTTFTFNGLW